MTPDCPHTPHPVEGCRQEGARPGRQTPLDSGRGSGGRPRLPRQQGVTWPGWGWSLPESPHPLPATRFVLMCPGPSLTHWREGAHISLLHL